MTKMFCVPSVATIIAILSIMRLSVAFHSPSVAISKISWRSTLFIASQLPGQDDYERAQFKKFQEEKKFNEQLAKNRMRFEERGTDYKVFQANKQQQQEQQRALQSAQTASMSTEERRTEEEWRVRMQIAAATATATTDILIAATDAAKATASATIDILASATSAAQATASAAVDILAAATSTATATASAATTLLQDEVERRLNEERPLMTYFTFPSLPFVLPPLPFSASTLPFSLPALPFPTPFSSASSSFESDGSTKLKPKTTSNGKNIQNLELKIVALREAQEQQQSRLKVMKDEEEKLAAMSLDRILEEER